MSFSTLSHLFLLSLGLMVGLPVVLGCMNTVEIACSLDEFTTLCAVVELAGLGGDFENGNWTFFAPTNDAFGALPGSLLDAALNNTALMTDILLFHAIPEVLSASMLNCTETIEMANGQESRTVCAHGETFQKGGGNDRAMMPKIVSTDIETCQGFVHVIENIIMLPPSLATEETNTTML